MNDGASLPAETELRRVKDGEVLLSLPNGLFFARREKHECKPSFDRLKGDKLVRATDRVRGSKFVATWTLSVYVTWLRQQVALLGWDRDTAAGTHDVETGQVVGISTGKAARIIRVEISSGCVHAYPVME